MADSPILLDIAGRVPVDMAFLESTGHRVLVCHGPAFKSLCPILAGNGCPLAEEAHGVVFQLDLDRPQHRAILARYKTDLRDNVPIWVVASSRQAQDYAQLLTGLKVLDHAPAAGDLDGLAAEVEAADSF